jgi:tetratricopeptide (TPR) repeat protein
MYGVALWRTGRLEEAIAEEQKAVELDPVSLVNNTGLGLAFYYNRRYDQAIAQERKTLEFDPNYVSAHQWLGNAYVQKSMYGEGIGELEKASSASPSAPIALSWLGYAYALTGRRADAQKVLMELSELAKQEYVPAVDRARVYAGLGEKDKAFEWLENGLADRSIANIRVEAPWDALRSDPRFADLLRRMNLQP